MNNRSRKPAINENIVFLLVLLCIGVFFFIKGSVDFADMNYKVRVFPLGTAALVVVLCLVEFTRGYFEKRKLEDNGSDNAENGKTKGKDKLKPYIVGFGWLLFIPVVTQFFGFNVSIPLYSLLFLRSKKVGWVKSIIIAAVMFCVVFFGFGMLLRLRLYPGMLFG